MTGLIPTQCPNGRVLIRVVVYALVFGVLEHIISAAFVDLPSSAQHQTGVHLV